MADDATVASVVCAEAQNLLGDAWLLWEPESIWKELHHKGIDVPLGNRQQLMAGRGLRVHGRFYYDGLVFDRTCAAFANEVLAIDELDETLAMHLAWGVDEAKVIDDSPVEFDREVIATVAAQLYEEGMVLCPDELSFAQEALNALWPCDTAELRQATQKLWGELRTHDLKAFPFPETPKGVQAARLAAIQVFLDERRGVRDRQASKLAREHARPART